MLVHPTLCVVLALTRHVYCGINEGLLDSTDGEVAMKNLEAAQVKMEEKLNSMTNFIDQELEKTKDSPISSTYRRKRAADGNPLMDIPKQTVVEIIQSMKKLNEAFDVLQTAYEGFKTASIDTSIEETEEGQTDDYPEDLDSATMTIDTSAYDNMGNDLTTERTEDNISDYEAMTEAGAEEGDGAEGEDAEGTTEAGAEEGTTAEGEEMEEGAENATEEGADEESMNDGGADQVTEMAEEGFTGGMGELMEDNVTGEGGEVTEDNVTDGAGDFMEDNVTEGTGEVTEDNITEGAEAVTEMAQGDVIENDNPEGHNGKHGKKGKGRGKGKGKKRRHGKGKGKGKGKENF